MPETNTLQSLDIKDPLYGYIHLTGPEALLLDQKPCQRLRRIRSPACTYMAYSGSGTNAMSRMLGSMHISEAFVHEIGGDSDEIQKARLASMFLSLATGPWSNITEEYLATRGFPKIKVAKSVLSHSVVSEILDHVGFSNNEILNYLTKGVPVKGIRIDLSRYPINPELVDSLMRDAFFAGVDYAQLEYHRLFDATRIMKNKIAVERTSLFTLESYLSAGANMFDAVYYHKTVRAADLMLLRILDQIGSQMLPFPTDDIEEFMRLDDISFHGFFLKTGEESEEEEVREASRLYSDYNMRYLLKLASDRAISDVAFLQKISTPDGLFDLESEIAEEADIDPHSVFLDYPDRVSVSYYPGKLPLEQLLLFERGSEGFEFWPVNDVSLIARSFGRQLKAVRVYTTRGYRARVRKAADKLLESVDQHGQRG